MSTFTHALSQNNYGSAKFIVATSAANGTHTTMTAAMAAASVGDTIVLRDSITENFTLTPGINIACWSGSALNTPSITGKITMTGAGTSTISGITLITNSDFCVAVTGSAASVLNLNNCFISCSNNTGISFISSSSSAQIIIKYSRGNVATTGISLYSMSSAGLIQVEYSIFGNGGGSTTATTQSAGIVNYKSSEISFPIANSGSTATTNLQRCSLSPGGQTALTINSTQPNGNSIVDCQITTLTSSAISIGAGSLLFAYGDNFINSSNANIVTGSGTFEYDIITKSELVTGAINAGSNVALAMSTGAIQASSINFGGTSLNTYVQNTFTPGIAFGGGTTGITYTSQAGKYTQIGNVVFFSFSVVLSNKGSSTGTATFTGLPITSGGLATAIQFQPGTLTFSGNYLSGIVDSGGTTGRFINITTGLATTALDDTAFANTSTIQFSGFYYTS